MPRGDGTGPLGQGQGTGWRGGGCADAGCGFRGHWAHGGHGWRHGLRAPGVPEGMRGSTAPSANPQREAQRLRSRAEALQVTVEAIRTRLAEIEADLKEHP